MTTYSDPVVLHHKCQQNFSPVMDKWVIVILPNSSKIHYLCSFLIYVYWLVLLLDGDVSVCINECLTCSLIQVKLSVISLTRGIIWQFDIFVCRWARALLTETTHAPSAEPAPASDSPDHDHQGLCYVDDLWPMTMIDPVRAICCKLFNVNTETWEEYANMVSTLINSIRLEIRGCVSVWLRLNLNFR